MSRSQRRAMIDREEPKLSLVRQCVLLGISRSSLYYLPTEAGAEDMELMALIDQQYLKTPFYGSRRMTAWLSNHGHQVNRKRVRRLMQLIRLEALAQPLRAGLAAVQHPGGRLLCCGSGRGLEQGSATDLQHRPGQPVHQRGLHQHAAGARRSSEHGRQGPLHGQRLRGTAVAQHQVRGGVPEGIPKWD